MFRSLWNKVYYISSNVFSSHFCNVIRVVLIIFPSMLCTHVSVWYFWIFTPTSFATVRKAKISKCKMRKRMWYRYNYHAIHVAADGNKMSIYPKNFSFVFDGSQMRWNMRTAFSTHRILKISSAVCKCRNNNRITRPVQP